MPTNLYGYNDNYHPENSHVFPALIRKFHEAKINNADYVNVWGSGTPKREFLFALADACFFLIQNYSEPNLVNIVTGQDISIKGLALLMKEIIGYDGTLQFDSSKPDGTPRKLMDVTKLEKLGWEYSTELREGIKLAYDDFLRTAK